MRSVSDLGVRLSGVAVGILLQALAGCSDPNSPSTGAIEVTVTTVGAERHPNGYSVGLDGGAGQLVAVNGSVTVTGLKAGDHTVVLGDIAPCTLNGSNPRNVSVVAGSTTQVAFALSCSSAVSVAGVWDWTERISPPGGYTCSDTGSYAFAQVGPSFTGTSDQVGSCSGFGNVIDNTRSDPLSSGLVFTGDSLRFKVVACVYRGVVSGDPPSSISGVVSCDTLNRPQGTWQAHPGGPPATVTVSPDSLRKLVGDSGQLTVALRDAAGSRVFRRPISWSSGNPTVATVDLTGMVKAVGAGKTGITASAGGASGTGKVGVELGGIFRITSLTGGTDLDPTGYVLAAGGVARRVGVNTTGDLPRLFAGTYSVGLSDVASNCTVSGDDPRMLAVTEGATTTSTFQVTCVHTTKLALSSYGSVGVIYADGSNLVTLAAGSAPSWSPDESRIAFSCAGSGGAYDICTVSPDGTALVRVTSEQSPGFIDAAWKRDGSKIAAGSRRGGSLELYVMNPDGSGAMPITRNVGYRGRPAWSPDGTKIAFDCQVDAGNDDICVINADGTGFARLTSDPAADAAAAWKPDGSQIAFATSRYGAFEVVLMSSEGGGVARINGGTPGLDPAWSRDGAKIAFSREDGGCDPDNGCYDSYDLYVMNADGSALVQLSSAGDDHEPDWRP